MKAVDIVGYDGFNASNDLLGLRNGARHELVADMAWQLTGIIVYLTITPAMGFQKKALGGEGVKHLGKLA